MVKFFRASDEETYSLQIDDHFEVLTKKTQMFSRHQNHRFGRQDCRSRSMFLQVRICSICKNHNSKLTRKLRQTNYLVHRSFFVYRLCRLSFHRKEIYSFSQMPTFFRKFELYLGTKRYFLRKEFSNLYKVI